MGIPAIVASSVAKTMAKVANTSNVMCILNVMNILEEEGIQLPDRARYRLRLAMASCSIAESCQRLDTQSKLDGFLKKHPDFVAPMEMVLGGQNRPDTYMYVPIPDTLKFLLKFNDVYHAILNDHVRQDGLLGDIVDGLAYKMHPVFGMDRNALTMIFYSDEFKVTSPMRSYSKNYKLTSTYMILANLAPDVRNRIHGIQLVNLCRSKFVKEYGLAAVMEKCVTDVEELVQKGFTCPRNGEMIHLNADILVMTGDNASQNSFGGFMEGFQAWRTCRICIVTLPELKQGRLGARRNRVQHDLQVAEVEQTPAAATGYGVKGRSCFSGISHWHPALHLPSDESHDIFEGVGKNTLQAVIQYCVQRRFLTYGDINAAMKNFEFKDTDKNDKPQEVTPGGLHLTMSQCKCLLRLLPLMIGTFIPAGDNHWDVLIKLAQIVELVCAPLLHPGQVDFMGDLIDEFNTTCRQVLGGNDTPKDHFLLHYKQQFFEFGPLRHISTLKMEEKHNWFMDAFKLNKCTKNPTKSLGFRHQFYQLAQSRRDNLYESSVRLTFAKKKLAEEIGGDIGNLIRASFPNSVISMGQSVVVHCTAYAKGSAILLGQTGETLSFEEITHGLDIDGEAYIATLKLETLSYEKHFNCYCVRRTAVVDLHKICDLVDRFPLGIYQVPGRNCSGIVLKHKPAFPSA